MGFRSGNILRVKPYIEGDRGVNSRHDFRRTRVKSAPPKAARRVIVGPFIAHDAHPPRETNVKYAVTASFFLAPIVAIILIFTSGNNPTDQPPQPLSEALLTSDMAAFTLAEPGTPFPNTPFLDKNEEPITIAGFRGKIVLVNLWATWCAPCLKEMPSLDRLQSKLDGDDFLILTISSDRTGSVAVQPFFERTDIVNLTPYYDPRGAVGRAIGTLALPTSVLIDANGFEIGRLVAPAEWDGPEAVALIRNLRKE